MAAVCENRDAAFFHLETFFFSSSAGVEAICKGWSRAGLVLKGATKALLIATQEKNINELDLMMKERAVWGLAEEDLSRAVVM